MRKLTTAEFIMLCKQRHGERYDYSLTAYELSTKPLTIICPEHGPFMMRPGDHRRGQGCPACGKLSMAAKMRDTHQDFVRKAQKVHNNRYRYDKVVYKNCHTKVIITCPVHGDFEQKPNSHLSNGNGCIVCSRSKHPGRYREWHFKTKEAKKKPGHFYVVRFSNDDETFIKIGITSMPVKERYYGRTQKYSMEILRDEKTTLYKAYKKEQDALARLRQFKYTPIGLLEGRTECFTEDVLPLLD